MITLYWRKVIFIEYGHTRSFYSLLYLKPIEVTYVRMHFLFQWDLLACHGRLNRSLLFNIYLPRKFRKIALVKHFGNGEAIILVVCHDRVYYQTTDCSITLRVFIVCFFTTVCSDIVLLFTAELVSLDGKLTWLYYSFTVLLYNNGYVYGPSDYVFPISFHGLGKNSVQQLTWSPRWCHRRYCRDSWCSQRARRPKPLTASPERTGWWTQCYWSPTHWSTRQAGDGDTKRQRERRG